MYQGYLIDQADYPPVPRVSRGDILYFRETKLVHPADAICIDHIKTLLKLFVFEGTTLHHILSEMIQETKKNSTLERLLSVIVTICVYKQKWDWIPVREINQYITSHSDYFPNPIKNHHYQYLAKNGYLKLLMYDGQILSVAPQPKIADLLTPKYLIIKPKI